MTIKPINSLYVILPLLVQMQCVFAQTQTQQFEQSIKHILSEQKLTGAVWTIVMGDSIYTNSAGLFTYLRTDANYMRSVNFWGLIMLLQCCILLWWNGIFPLVLWR